MNTHILPAAVETYFAVIDGDAREKAIDSFAADAHVTDDGSTYRGRDDVLSWLTGAASEWETTSTRLSVTTEGQVTTVATRIVGNFPGGQVDLRQEFVLDDEGLIQRLTIAV